MMNLLNCYNKEGQTPLIQAMKQGREEYAIQLASSPRVDINAPQILVGTCSDYERKRRYYYWMEESLRDDFFVPFFLPKMRSSDNKVGSMPSITLEHLSDIKHLTPEDFHGASSYFIAQHTKATPELLRVLEARDDREKSESVRFISADTIIKFNTKDEVVIDALTNNEFLDFLVHSNLATLKSAIRSYGKKILKEVSEEHLNILHFAVNMKQLDKVEFLLDIDAINELLTEDQKISEEEFTNFINARTIYDSRAFESLVVAKHPSKDLKVVDIMAERLDQYKQYSVSERKKCILMFFSCPEFDPAAKIAFTVRILPSFILEFNDISFTYQCSRARPHFDWNVKNSQGHSLLKEACLENRPGNIKQLVTLQALGTHVDPNEYKEVYNIENTLKEYVKRNWFGKEVKLVGVDIAKLVNVLRTKEPVTVQVEYMKFQEELTEEAKKYVKDVMRFAFDYHYNKEKMKGVVSPHKDDLQLKIASSSVIDERGSVFNTKTEFEKLQLLLDGLEDHHWWLKRSQFSINFEGFGVVWITGKNGKETYVKEDRVITYDLLKEKLPDYLFDRRGRVKAQYLAVDYGSLMTEMARLGYGDAFREFVNFRGIDFKNPVVEGHILSDSTSGEIKRLYLEAKEQDAERRTDAEKLEERKAKVREEITTLESAINKLENAIKELESRKLEISAALRAEKDKDKLEEIKEEKTSLTKKMRDTRKPLNKKKSSLEEKHRFLAEYVDLPRSKDAREIAIKMLDPSKGPDLVRFANLLSEQLLSENLKKGTEKYRENSLVRRMDALSKLYLGTDVCSAITFVSGEGFIISFNYSNGLNLTEVHKKHIDRVRLYLKKVADNAYTAEQRDVAREACVIESVIQGLYREKHVRTLDASPHRSCVTNIIKALNTTDTKDLPDISRYKMDGFGAFANHDINAFMLLTDLDYDGLFETLYPTEEARAERNSKNKFRSLVTNSIRMFYSIKKVEHSITTSDRRQRFPDEMLAAFKAERLTVVQEYDKINIHAEMRVLGHLLTHKKSPFPYLGIPKLCCVHCRMVISAMNDSTALHLDYDIGVRGSHGASYKWEIPGFLADRGMLIQIFAKTEELRDLFEKIGEENALKILSLINNFIDDYKFDFSKMIKYINRNILPPEGAVSTSRPGLTTLVASTLGAVSEGPDPGSPRIRMPVMEENIAARRIQNFLRKIKSDKEGKTFFQREEEKQSTKETVTAEMGQR